MALPAPFGRFPGLALAVAPGRPEPVDSFVSDGYTTLPVRPGDEERMRHDH
ncbi:hypothetical protein ACIPSE_21055 [Streptomyces sp. NPDC090106]|uniref:hypothetical protein n=1 Tax=Streptomyces sp. NPDC090106 TaxID=3365946 RepID=UPI00380DC3E2